MLLIYKTHIVKYTKKGFTLIEVLITLVLVGIISAIAVPNYNRYTRSAKQASAKSSLSQIYMAQKSFHLNWKTYTSNLIVAGVTPEGEMLYNAGFSETDIDPATITGMPTPLQEKIKATGAAGFDTFSEICGTGFGTGEVKACAFTKGTPPNLVGVLKASKDKFRAMAIADIINKTQKEPTSGANKDAWCINQYKQIGHVSDGTRTGDTADANKLYIKCPP